MWNFIVKKKKENKPINVVLVRVPSRLIAFFFAREFPTGHM